MRINYLFSHCEKISFVALNFAFLGSIETARSKEGFRALRKAFDQYPTANVEEDKDEKVLRATLSGDGRTVVAQIDLGEKSIAIAARPQAPFADTDDGFDSFCKNAIGIFATDFDLTPRDLAMVEFRATFVFDNTPPPPSSIIDVLLDKEVFSDVSRAGLTPIETEHEILFLTKEPNLRSRLNLKSTTSTADAQSATEPRKSNLRMSLGVAMIKEHSSYKSIPDLSAQLLLKSWELTHNVCDPIICKKIIQPPKSA